MFKRVSTLSLLGLAVLITALASACAAASPPGQDRNFRTINVNGTGTVYGSPDIATADISVVTRNETVKPASDENTRLMTAVIAAVKALGVEDKDFRTSNYSISIEQKTNPDGSLSDKREYVINNTVSVTFRDLSKVGEGLQAAISAGANEISNITFGVEDTAKLAAEARNKAMADAQARAEQLAKAAGASIDKPYSISESFYLPQAGAFKSNLGGGMVEAAAPVPVQSGQISVQVDVSVTYLIK